MIVKTDDMAAFTRMLNKAMDVRSLSIGALAEETEINLYKLQQWSDGQWRSGIEPSSIELAALAKVLGIPESDIEQWAERSISFSDQVWLLAAVLLPGLNRDAWDELDISDEQALEEGLGGPSPGLVDALIPLVMRFGPRVVARVAEDLFRQTNEGKEEKTVRAMSASEERWDRQSRAAESRGRSGGSRKNSDIETARRLLGG